MTELAEKRRRVRELISSHDLDAVVLRNPGNVAWYSGGGRTHVLSLADVGVADLVITAENERVVVPRNEVDRLIAEELGSLDPQVDVVSWSHDRLASLPNGSRVGFDVAPPGERDVSAEIEVLRRSLTPDEVDRYRSLGHEAAGVFTEVLSDVGPDTTERQLAAAIGGSLLEVGADPIVLLVAGGSRVGRHRHPLPTTERLGALAMAVICARRGGLIVALTRFVSFGALPPELADSYARLLDVEHSFLAATVPGSPVGAAYRAGSAAYATCGFDADESDLHHQGGPIGYFARDYLATPTSSALVAPMQAFAWNPSVPSLKVEDTVLARPDGLEVLTVDPRWPAVANGGIIRPQILSR